jgi:hypothetical protein
MLQYIDAIGGRKLVSRSFQFARLEDMLACGTD